MRDSLSIARSIGDRFVAWQGTIGRPDPQKVPVRHDRSKLRSYACPLAAVFGAGAVSTL